MMKFEVRPKHMLLALVLTLVLSAAAHAGVLRVIKKVFVKVITAPVAIVHDASFDIARQYYLEQLYSSTK